MKSRQILGIIGAPLLNTFRFFPAFSWPSPNSSSDSQLKQHENSWESKGNVGFVGILEEVAKIPPTPSSNQDEPIHSVHGKRLNLLRK